MEADRPVRSCCDGLGKRWWELDPEGVVRHGRFLDIFYIKPIGFLRYQKWSERNRIQGWLQDFWSKQLEKWIYHLWKWEPMWETGFVGRGLYWVLGYAKFRINWIVPNFSSTWSSKFQFHQQDLNILITYCPRIARLMGMMRYCVVVSSCISLILSKLGAKAYVYSPFGFPLFWTGYSYSLSTFPIGLFVLFLFVGALHLLFTACYSCCRCLLWVLGWF